MNFITTARPSCTACGCEAAEPLLICFTCSEGTDINGHVVLTGYCSSTCREIDKSQHKKACTLKNERKALYRAGEILQTVFYAWREIAFDIKIKKVWKVDEVLCFMEDHYEGGVSLYPFPNEMFETPRDKEKMLSYGACTDAQGHLFDLCKGLIEGLAEGPHELDITIDQRRLRIRRCYTWGLDPSVYLHQVLEVMLRDSEGYIIDLAGAQNGQFRAVLPSKEYMSRHAVAVTARKDFGWQANQQDDYIYREIKEGRLCIWRASAEMKNRMKVAMRKWEDDGSRTIRDLPRGNQRSYDEGKATFMTTIRDALQGFMKDMENGSWFAM